MGDFTCFGDIIRGSGDIIWGFGATIRGVETQFEGWRRNSVCFFLGGDTIQGWRHNSRGGDTIQGWRHNSGLETQFRVGDTIQGWRRNSRGGDTIQGWGHNSGWSRNSVCVGLGVGNLKN